MFDLPHDFHKETNWSPTDHLTDQPSDLPTDGHENFKARDCHATILVLIPHPKLIHFAIVTCAQAQGMAHICQEKHKNMVIKMPY